MKQSLFQLLRPITSSFTRLNKLKLFTIMSLVCLLFCVLFLLFGKPVEHSKTVATSTHPSPTVILTSTKWWIKATPSSLSVDSIASMTAISKDTSGKCPFDATSGLQAGTYGYISSSPPLPNRLRSGAGTNYSYIGQVEPGTGVKIIDGPLCADGLSWWLVESNDTYLKGWTATRNGPEQWIIPCVDPNIPCSKATIDQATSIVTAENNDLNRCKSYLFAIGMFSQVKPNDLLVIRSEPYTGAVVGYAGPGSKVRIVDGPSCAGKAIWWKVNNSNNNLTGWTTEANLTPCSKEECP